MPDLANQSVEVWPAALLEDAYEHAPCGYIVTNVDGSFIMVNQTFLQLTGYDRATLLEGRRLQDVLTLPGRIFYETHYAPLMRMQGFVHELAVDLVCRDGSQHPVLLSSSQRVDAQGDVDAYRTILFLARDRRLYEQELMRARRAAEHMAQAKASLLAMLGHEIGTPVTAIGLAAQALARGVDTARQQRYLPMLLSSAQTLQALVHDILDYSSLEAGTMILQAQPFSMRALIEGVIHTVADRAEEKQLALEVDIAETIPPQVIGDRVKIGQILTNLLSNAIKFTAHGFVRVALTASTVQPELARLRLSVTDSGIGIAPERLSRVFEEFTQASQDIAVQYGGTGLGLTISQKIAALYGSTIEVVSQSGVGSTFAIELELATVP